MAMLEQDIQRMIEEAIPSALVQMEDLAGDGDHFAVHVISESFKDKTRIQQHQMVYQALGTRVGGQLHALAIRTSVPPQHPNHDHKES